MRLILLLISISFLSCSSKHSGSEDIVKTTVTVDTVLGEKEYVKVKECECIDFKFSQKGVPPLLTHKIGTSKIIVCGYHGEYEENIILGKRQQDSSFYVSGFVVFNCSGSELNPLFEEGEYYLDIIKPETEELEIVRLVRMPQDKSLKYKWTPVVSIKFYEKNGLINIDTSFVLPMDDYNKDFLKHFESEIEKVKNSSSEKLNYADYLIDYHFIQAVKNPEKYSKKLKSIGPFDGYLGPIYRDVLKYYEIFEKQKKGG